MFTTNSFCNGGRHHSSTTNIVSDKTIKMETGEKVKLLDAVVQFVLENELRLLVITQ